MSSIKIFISVVLLGLLFTACDKDEPGSEGGTLNLVHVYAGSTEIRQDGTPSTEVPVDASLALRFSGPVDRATTADGIRLKQDGNIVATNFGFGSQDITVLVYPAGVLESSTVYTLEITPALRGANGERVEPLELSFSTRVGALTVTAINIDGRDIRSANRVPNVPVELKMAVNFSVPVNPETFKNAVGLAGPGNTALEIVYADDHKSAEITASGALQYLTKYDFSISSQLKGASGESFTGFHTTLYTQVDSSYKFPEISDDALLTKVQEQTFKYFWDFAHPGSGLARERNTSGNTVTIGGSGFGVMSILVGIERGFISRQQGVDRLRKIVDFLETADRFHGVWPHWIDGNSGKVVPFSTKDNGGDLVETAFMIQGLLSVREYLNPGVPQEAAIITTITRLWEAVEWDWYTQGGQNVLYWHWSPDYGWEMNHRIQGWNEALIVYVLAASSPTHPIDPEVYHEGWARGGNMQNGTSYHGINLPLGEAFGGPLFFAHYSFLGLDPRQLKDQYADYWQQNVNHSLINRQHAVANPQNWIGYGEQAWGFTASDNQQGYAAHSPTNDLGVITPTAALSSMPYTPQESMDALRHFYYIMGDKLWGEYGFRDAYNPTAQWYASSYLAIDQGPIIIMIENHRTALLWNLFMSAPEVTAGLDRLGFSY